MENRFSKKKLIDFLKGSFDDIIEVAIKEDNFGELSFLSEKASKIFGENISVFLERVKGGLSDMNYRLILIGGNGYSTSFLMKRYDKSVFENSYFERIDRRLGRYGAFWLKQYYETNRSRRRA